MSREESGQVLYSGTMRAAVKFSDFTGTLTNNMRVPSAWVIEFYDRAGRLLNRELLPFLPHTGRFFQMCGFCAIFTRVR